MNLDIFKEKYLYPLAEKDSQGVQRKLTIEPNVFQNTGECEGLVMKYSFAKGESVYFVATPMIFGAICKCLEDVLRSKEAGQPVVFEYQPNPNKPAVKIAVGRDETDLRPFLAIGGDINGKTRSKKFYWNFPKGYTLSRGGQAQSDLAGSELIASAFLERGKKFVEWLDEKYKAREFQQGGRGNGGGGGGNNNYRQPGGDTDFDGMF